MCKMNSTSDFSSPHLLFPQIHTNTPTQRNQHKDIQIHPHGQTNTKREREREREREIGVGVGHLWIGGSVLMAKIRVCGSMEMGFDAYGSVLAVEIGACALTKSVLVGFYSCGACGGD